MKWNEMPLMSVMPVGMQTLVVYLSNTSACSTNCVKALLELTWLPTSNAIRTRLET
jgi:hypothetical protein